MNAPIAHAEELNARRDLAVLLARQAGKLTLEHFQQGVGFERKADNSPVTIADRGAEQYLRREIAGHFPDDAILGEEFGEQAGTSGWRWILDPIDGTKSFICGVPLYGTLVGLEYHGQPLAGVIEIPALNERVYASIGGGAWYIRGDESPVPAKVSSASKLGDGALVTSQVDTFNKRGAGEAFNQLQKLAYVTRTWGDCYGYLLVATGRALVMIDPMMSVWDAAAILPVMVEAGGSFTDWQGQPTVNSGEGIGSNGRVHEEVLKVTRTFPRLG